MGVKNYLVDGASCAGKTTVCNVLQRLGYHCIHGDRELAYWGNPETGQPINDSSVENRSWIWDIEKVGALAADQSHAVTFLCGGSRNLDSFIHLFDAVFILEIDLETLNRRLAARPKDEWSGSVSEGESLARSYVTRKAYPKGAIVIDATGPVSDTVAKILEKANLPSS